MDGQTDKHGEGFYLFFFEVLRTSLNTYDTNRITSHYLMYFKLFRRINNRVVNNVVERHLVYETRINAVYFRW